MPSVLRSSAAAYIARRWVSEVASIRFPYEGGLHLVHLFAQLALTFRPFMCKYLHIDRSLRNA